MTSEKQFMFFNFYNRKQYVYPASVMRSKTNKGLVFGVVFVSANNLFHVYVEFEIYKFSLFVI